MQTLLIHTHTDHHNVHTQGWSTICTNTRYIYTQPIVCHICNPKIDSIITQHKNKHQNFLFPHDSHNPIYVGSKSIIYIAPKKRHSVKYENHTIRPRMDVITWMWIHQPQATKNKYPSLCAKRPCLRRSVSGETYSPFGGGRPEPPSAGAARRASRCRLLRK